MQFKVPQFLDIEDTIFGPFTFKQFVYLVGGGGLCFVLYKLMGLLFGLIPILIVAGFALSLAFYRPNGKPFIHMIEAGFNYLLQDKLFVWKKRKNKTEKRTQKDNTTDLSRTLTAMDGSRLTGNKLRDLAWSLDVLDLKKEDK